MSAEKVTMRAEKGDMRRRVTMSAEKVTMSADKGVEVTMRAEKGDHECREG